MTTATRIFTAYYDGSIQHVHAAGCADLARVSAHDLANSATFTTQATRKAIIDQADVWGDAIQDDADDCGEDLTGEEWRNFETLTKFYPCSGVR